MPFLTLKVSLSQALADAVGLPGWSKELILSELVLPPNPQMGHLAFPCFKLSKELKKDANHIATELVTKLKFPQATFQVAGPYLNAKFHLAPLCKTLLQQIEDQKNKFGSDQTGGGKQIIFEFCAPNIAKRLGFHHIRTTLIGNVIANIHAFLGAKSIRMNFIGDWGAQFAKLAAAVELWGDVAKLKALDPNAAMDYMLDLYVRFHQESETNEELKQKSNACLHRLEKQDPASTALWKTIRDISVASMDKTLQRMNITFDVVEGESQYIPAIEQVLEEVKTKAKARLSEGAWIVDVEGLTTPALIQKKDGTTLYLTRDIAAAKARHAKYHFDSMYYVVSEQQKLHFQLLFGVLKKMGFAWANQCHHVSYGTVLFGAQKMSTREGKMIVLESVLDEAKELALKECSAKNPDLPNKEIVSEQVGLAAIIFGNLSNHRMRDFEFDWKNVLAFDGETGPYVQYSLVRCQSLLKKANSSLGRWPASETYSFAVEEEQLILMLSRFRAALHAARAENEPFFLTSYLIDCAKAFNKFYYQLPVLQAAEEAQKHVRLHLVVATQTVLSNGLRLLGIPCPAEM